jgi:hypothetical protein
VNLKGTLEIEKALSGSRGVAGSRFQLIFAVFFIDNQHAEPKNRLMDQPMFRPARLTPAASLFADSNRLSFSNHA